MNGKCPYDVVEPIITKVIMDKMGFERIKVDNIKLSPELLKEGDN